MPENNCGRLWSACDLSIFKEAADRGALERLDIIGIGCHLSGIMIEVRHSFHALLFCLFAMGGLTAAESVAPAQVDGLLPSYFAVQEALADDSLADAKKAAAQLTQILDKASPDEAVSGMGPSARKIAGAESIDAARKAFQTLSDAMIKRVSEKGASGADDVYLAHCPMAFGYKGADWLQSSKEIANPYFGDEMLRCGVIQKQLAGTEEN